MVVWAPSNYRSKESESMGVGGEKARLTRVGGIMESLMSCVCLTAEWGRKHQEATDVSESQSTR